MAGGRRLYVQSLPVVTRPSKFQEHQEAVRQDVMQRLGRLGVDVAGDFSSSPSPPVVLAIFQSTGRVGDELPSALDGLDKSVKEHVDILAVIQDSPHTRVGKEALPPGFSPKLLLDLVVVPGTSRLKQCPENDEALKKFASVVGTAARDSPIPEGIPSWLVKVALVVLFLGALAYSRWGPRKPLE